MPAASPLPNFLVIYADDLGFGDLGCYGASRIPTPHLDRLAARGLRHTQAYATAATCTPSRYSLLSGCYPWRNPRAHILAGDAPLIFAPDEPTLPRLLREHGYATGLVGKWHLGLGDGRAPLDWNGAVRPGPLECGFTEAFIMAATNDRVPCVYVEDDRVRGLDPADPLQVDYASPRNPFPDSPAGRDHPELLRLRHSHDHDGTIVNGVGRIGHSRGGRSALWCDETMSDTFLERAKSFLDRHAERPFFLYYALHQPHVPRLPSPRFAGSTALGPRGDVIAELDWCVGQILEHLERLGLAENTLVLFSSDNGPAIDDGYQDQAAALLGEHRPAGPLRGGKYSRFDGGVRVPTIVSWPGRVRPGESSALLSQVDLLASFAALAGIPLAPAAARDSRDHSAAFLGHEPAGRQSLVTEGLGARTVLRHGPWVYLPPCPGVARFEEKNIETGYADHAQLYHLGDDPGQRHDRAAEQPALLDLLAYELASQNLPQAPALQHASAA